MERAGVQVHAFDLLGDGPWNTWQALRRLASEHRPDWIIGCSDIYYGIAAVRLASEVGARSAIDSYDDFEAYIPRARPLHWLWRRALRQADLRISAGPQLAARMVEISRDTRQPCMVPMSADPIFHRADRSIARESFGIAHNIPVFGYLGSIAPGRDVSTLWEAIPMIRKTLPEAVCLASGRRQIEVGEGVRHLGYLRDEQMPILLSGLDLAVVTAEPNRFGLGSYPSKLYEAIACGVPMVCADLPNLRWIAGERAHYYRSGDSESLAAAIIEQLQSSSPVDPLPGWADVAEILERHLTSGKFS